MAIPAKVLLLVISICAACGMEGLETVNHTNRTRPQTQTSHESSSDAQFEKWQAAAFQQLIDRWLSGEDIDGKVVDLNWAEEARRYVSLGGYQAKAALLDVNGDGQKELAFLTGCATVGNCDFYLYQRESEGVKKLLFAHNVQQFELTKTKTNGFYDIETSSHASAISGGIAVYNFDGSKYQISECFLYKYELTGRLDSDGQAITADKPRLTKVDCPIRSSGP